MPLFDDEPWVLPDLFDARASYSRPDYWWEDDASPSIFELSTDAEKAESHNPVIRAKGVAALTGEREAGTTMTQPPADSRVLPGMAEVRDQQQRPKGQIKGPMPEGGYNPAKGANIHGPENLKTQPGGLDPNGWYNYAKSQIGIDYVFGSWNAAGQEDGTGSAFDCSGFTGAVLEASGYKEIPHSAYRQSLMFNHLKKNELKPGDLIFYNYGRLGKGIADHVAIYLGNGRQIAASSSADKVTVQSVDWGHFMFGGDTKLSGGAPSGRGPQAQGRQGRQRTRTQTAYPDVTLVPGSMGSAPDLSTVTANLYTSMFNDAANREKRTPAMKDPKKGVSGSIKEQLYRGFMDAGAPDLAKMVNSKDFQTWIDAESGWDPNSVSKYYDGHGRNAGLFQFALLDRAWVWNDVNRSNWSYQSTPYQQAKDVVRYFNLTPGDVRRYAEQIRQGTYSGWG